MNSNVHELPSRDEIEAELESVDYVAGRLDDDARAAFEARLRRDASLVARVAEEREFVVTLSAAADGEGPPAQAFDALARELDKQERSSTRGPIALAAAIVATIAVLLFSSTPVPEPRLFETLESGAVQRIEDSRRYRIVFANESSALRDAVAAEFGFRIVSGPGPGGAYIVETHDGMTRSELEELRNDDRIHLAEPQTYEPVP